MSFSLDVESFISEVQKYPELWNVHSDLYKQRHKKIRAWGEIAKVFVEDYDELSERDKDEIYKKFFNKWRNIKDNYVRHLKKSNGINSSYLYASCLTFLRDIYKQSNLSDSEDQEQVTWASDDNQNKCLKTEFDSFWQNDDESSDSTRKKRKTEVEFVDTTFTEASSANEDKSFFDSLLPAVKDFTIDQKIEFRCDVLKLIQTYRQQSVHKE